MIIKETFIKAQFTGVIATGDFENERPLFEMSQLIEGDIDNGTKEKMQESLYSLCRKMFQQSERQSVAKRIMREREDIRFYPVESDQYPSVTSILNWDADFHVSPQELIQYAARGSIIDKQVEIYFRVGKWKDPKEIPECYPDLVILKKGSLELTYEDIDFLSFIKEYPIDFIDAQKTVFNHGFKYAGRYDLKGIPKVIKGNGWDKMGVKPLITLIDVKAASMDETKFMKQLTAYWHCEGNEDVEQAMIMHLNNKTQQGFSKPKICSDKNKYWELFKKDRENFKKRFQI